MAEQADAPQRDVSNTTAEPRERLTDAQSKTVQFLRELGKDDRARRQAALKNYRKYLQEGGGKALPPQADATPSLVSNSRMPVHFNIEADELLHDLPEARGAEGPTGSSPADTGKGLLMTLQGDGVWNLRRSRSYRGRDPLRPTRGTLVLPLRERVKISRFPFATPRHH